jgi:hypothetical protein
MTQQQEIPEYPDFDLIVEEVKEKMDAMFPKYGNSWKTVQGLDFWQKRLTNEFAEWCLCRLDSYEIIDIIAVCCMIRERLRG